MSRPWMGYLAGAAFALSAAGAATADPQGTAPSPGDAKAVRDERTVIIRGDGDERRMLMRPGDGRSEMGERVMMMRHGGRDQAERLRTLLQLKPGQEAALTAYLAATRPQLRHEHFFEMADREEAKTTPQRLADMEKRLAEQAAQGRARIEATRKFYDQLEPSQKKVFDQLPMLMIGPFGPMMPMGPTKVMVSMDRLPLMPPMPPLPPRPPHPPKVPPAPPL